MVSLLCPIFILGTLLVLGIAFGLGKVLKKKDGGNT